MVYFKFIFGQDNFFILLLSGIRNNNTNDVIQSISQGANVSELFGNNSLLIQRIN
jgi:hypothetical protein